MLLWALRRTALTPFEYIDRLPRGGDREFGGGYVMALAAVGTTVCYSLVVGVAVVAIVAAGGLSSATAFLVLAPVGLVLGALYERSRR